jgi:monoamine oxidase
MDKIAADRAVLAIPFSTLKRIAIDPPFSAAKSQAIANLTYHAATRFLLQTKTRFWQGQGLTEGHGPTVRPIFGIWATARRQRAD